MLTAGRQTKRARLGPARVGLAFKMKEKWDLVKVKDILAQKPSLLDEDGEYNHTLARDLGRILESGSASADGMVTTCYYAPVASLPFGFTGRVYSQGFSSVPCWVRRLCANKYYHDIDIVNCYPVLLYQLAKLKGVNHDLHCLKRYVENREEVFAGDMASIAGLTREECKEQYLKGMFGSSKLMYETEFLVSYMDEIKYITEFLWRMVEFKQILTYVRAKADEKTHIKSSFLSTVINTVERRIIDVAMKRVEKSDMGYSVGAYVFDGFMVHRNRGTGREVVFPVEHLQTLSDVVFAETEYRVHFLEKSLKPSVKDHEHLRHRFNNMDVWSKDDSESSFIAINTLADNLNEKPEPNNPEIFRKALVPLLNRSFARLRCKMNLIVIRSMKTNKVNDVEYDRWKQEDVKKMYANVKSFVLNGDGEKGGESIIPINVWLASPNVLCFKNIVFNPRPYNMLTCCTPFELNTYVGMAYPAKGSKLNATQLKSLEEKELRPFFDHIKNIWCQGNQEYFAYIYNWIWSKITRPWFHIETAIVLQSEQGSGKGIIIEKVAEVVGQRYLSTPKSLDQICGGAFNEYYYKHCLIMFLDEAMFAGSKATKNQVKTVITDKNISVNEKYLPTYQLENFSSIIMASNEEHAINCEVKNRRYFTLRLSDNFSGSHSTNSTNQEHFNAIAAVNPQVLSNYFHSVEREWTGKKLPTSLAGEDQGIRSMNKVQTFVYDFMQDPSILQECRFGYLKLDTVARENFEIEKGSDVLAGEYGKNAVYSYFKKHCSGRGGYIDPKKAFWDYVTKCFPSHEIKRRRCGGNKRMMTIVFPLYEGALVTYRRITGLHHTTFNTNNIHEDEEFI